MENNFFTVLHLPFEQARNTYMTWISKIELILSSLDVGELTVHISRQFINLEKNVSAACHDLYWALLLFILIFCFLLSYTYIFFGS
jgi:hypothetical protein